jgi:hypothetical protein
MLLYHVGGAKGNEPPSADDQNGKVIEPAQKREEKVW